MRTEAPTPASHSAFYLLHLQYVSGVNQVDSASHILSGPERGVCDSTTCLQVGVLWCLVNCTSDHHDLSLAARRFVCLSLIRTDTLFLSSTEATQKIHPVPSPALGLPVYTPSRCTWLSLIHWPLNWTEGSLTHSHVWNIATEVERSQDDHSQHCFIAILRPQWADPEWSLIPCEENIFDIPGLSLD